MKSPLVILLLCALFISCDSQKENTNTRNSSDIDALADESIGSNIIDTGSEYVISNANIGGGNTFSFKFNTDSVDFYLRSIDVFSGQAVVQNISVEQESYRSYDLTDWNFDGYKDISVCQGCGSAGCQYLIWNYSPSQNRFNFNEMLSGKLGLQLDSVNQYILFNTQSGYSHQYLKTFKYEGDSISFLKNIIVERHIDGLNQFWEKNTVTELINNKLVYDVDSFIIDKYGKRIH